jgi:hypothetical protein
MFPIENPKVELDLGMTMEASPPLTVPAEPSPPWTGSLETLIRTFDPSTEFLVTTRCVKAFEYYP